MLFSVYLVTPDGKDYSLKIAYILYKKAIFVKDLARYFNLFKLKSRQFMDKEILTQCAYHESGRIVFAYLADYSCNSMAISNIDAGKGNSILNGGNDNPIIQKLINGEKPLGLEKPEAAYEVAVKLTVIYCAGTCARVFYENGGKVNEDTDLDFPGQDSIRIEQLQKFMREYNAAYSEDYISRIIAGIFQRLAKPEIWKSISKLAVEAVENFDKPMTRFMIEDTLMASGFKIKRINASSGFGVGLSETPDEPVKEKEVVRESKPVADILDESPLDIVLKNYLRKIRTDWSEEDAATSANQIKSLFAKYGK